MPFFLYAIGLVVCGGAVSAQAYFSQWGEEPEWGWSVLIFWSGIVMMAFNAFGFATLALLRQRAQAWIAQVFLFLVGGLSGVISGGATGWLWYQPSSLPFLITLILVFAQAPLVVVIINWLLGRFIQPRRS